MSAIAHRANAHVGVPDDRGECDRVYERDHLCTLVLRLAALSRRTNRLKSIAATIPPDTKLRIGNKRSGTTYCDANSVTRPSAKTPSVCVIVTVNPRKVA